MNVLGVDTSSKVGSVALLQGNRVVDKIESKSAVSFSRSLLTMIDRLLARCKLDIEDISCLAVAGGPGSFTGIRIGMATLQGIALSKKIPVFGVSTLEAIASMVKPLSNPFIAMIDGGRDGVYWARFAFSGGSLSRESDDIFSKVEDSLAGSSTVYGNGADAHEAAVTAGGGVYNDFSGVSNGNCVAVGVAKIAGRKMEAGEVGKIFSLKPNYIRRSAAERSLKTEE